MPRIIVAECIHEVSSFNPIPTRYEDFFVGFRRGDSHLSSRCSHGGRRRPGGIRQHSRGGGDSDVSHPRLHVERHHRGGRLVALGRRVPRCPAASARTGWRLFRSARRDGRRERRRSGRLSVGRGAENPRRARADCRLLRSARHPDRTHVAASRCHRDLPHLSACRFLRDGPALCAAAAAHHEGRGQAGDGPRGDSGPGPRR